MKCHVDIKKKGQEVLKEIREREERRGEKERERGGRKRE